jgi:hypothetical protein
MTISRNVNRGKSAGLGTAVSGGACAGLRAGNPANPVISARPALSDRLSVLSRESP